MMKTLLLAGAAGLATVSLAQAADVPMDKAEAVEYVKVCSEFGTGFFYIPGTDTCLKIGGRVRAEYEFSDISSTADEPESNLGFDSSAMLKFDALTATELGTLRSYIEVSGSDGGSLTVDKAYIQLGGLTAGYAASMFDSGIGIGDAVVGSAWASDKTTNLLAYTATFGGGFYATLSIEDGVNRRNVLNGYNAVASVASVGSTPTSFASGSSAARLANVGASYAGHDIPDFVVALGASQDWGQFKVMGAIHEVDVLDSGAFASTGVDAEFGYALGAAVELKAAGFTFGLQGNYAEGAMSYIDDTAPDAVAYSKLDGTDSSELSSGYSLASSVGFAVSPSLSATLYGSYKNVDWGNPVGSDLELLTGSLNTNAESYALGVNATYVITPGLNLILAAAYETTQITSVSGTGNSPTTAPITSSSTDSDTTSFGVRLERNF